jgi:CheY-like chemotaxis protein
MDHMMPGMDGMEAAAKIRAIGTEYARKVPIIALTANAIAGNEKMFLENGFQAFLPKPVDIINLDSVVKKWIVG